MSRTASAPPLLRQAIRWVRAERTDPEYTPRQLARAERYVAAAELRQRSARESTLYAPVAVGLLRDAVAYLTRGVTAARHQEAPSLDDATALAELRAACQRGTGEDSSRLVFEALRATDNLHFDAMDPASLAATRDALEREAGWLRDQIDLRTPTYRAGARVGRLAAVAIGVVWLGYLAVGAAFRPKNLAFGRPVRASSRQEGTPDPSGLVDGKIASLYGFHTDVGKHDAWGIIDLQSPAPIRKIVVYNRSDQNPDDCLPLALDVSMDGVAFHEVARRKERFGDGGFLSAPWSVSLHDYGRYVRLRSARYLALNEVEVF